MVWSNPSRISKLGQFPGFTLALTLGQLHNSITKKMCLCSQSRSLIQSECFQILLAERAFLAKKGALRWEHAACPSAFQLIHPSEETCMFQLSIQTFPWFWCIRQTRQVALHVIRMWLLHAHGEIRHRFSYWHVLATSIGIKACMRSALCFGK